MTEQAAPAGSVGHRLARQRRLSEVTRAQLATSADLDPGLIAQVEQGEIAATPRFTGAVARALNLDVDTLYGQPYVPALTDPRAAHATVPALRAALNSEDDPQPAGPQLTATQLRARLDECDQDRAAARYRQLGATLPELLHQGSALQSVAAADAQAHTVAELLTDAYLLAQTVAYRFGYLDLTALCNRCARDAAARSADPLRMAVVAGQHALLRLYRGDHYGALLVADRTHDQIAEHISPAADAVRVALHLGEALANARIGSADRAQGHLTRVRDLIGRGIPAHPYPTVTATEANLDIHTVAVPLELGDPTTALARAEQIKIPTGEEPARLGRYFIDLAQAATLHGDHTQALHALQQARACAPQLVRYHPQARETVHLLTEHDRRANDTLAGFARWAGITL